MPALTTPRVSAFVTTSGDSWATELVGATASVHGVNNLDEMARLDRRVPEDLADEAARGTLLRARLAERSTD